MFTRVVILAVGLTLAALGLLAGSAEAAGPRLANSAGPTSAAARLDRSAANANRTPPNLSRAVAATGTTVTSAERLKVATEARAALQAKAREIVVAAVRANRAAQPAASPASAARPAASPATPAARAAQPTASRAAKPTTNPASSATSRPKAAGNPGGASAATRTTRSASTSQPASLATSISRFVPSSARPTSRGSTAPAVSASRSSTSPRSKPSPTTARAPISPRATARSNSARSKPSSATASAAAPTDPAAQSARSEAAPKTRPRQIGLAPKTEPLGAAPRGQSASRRAAASEAQKARSARPGATPRIQSKARGVPSTPRSTSRAPGAASNHRPASAANPRIPRVRSLLVLDLVRLEKLRIAISSRPKAFPGPAASPRPAPASPSTGDPNDPGRRILPAGGNSATSAEPSGSESAPGGSLGHVESSVPTGSGRNANSMARLSPVTATGSAPRNAIVGWPGQRGGAVANSGFRGQLSSLLHPAARSVMPSRSDTRRPTVLRPTTPVATREVIRGFFQPVEVHGSPLSLPTQSASAVLSGISLSIGSDAPGVGSSAGSSGSGSGGSASAVLPGAAGLTLVTWRSLASSDSPVPPGIDPIVPTPPG